MKLSDTARLPERGSAYAAGYDWAKGISGDNQFRPKVAIHYLPDAEKQKKKK